KPTKRAQVGQQIIIQHPASLYERKALVKAVHDDYVAAVLAGELLSTEVCINHSDYLLDGPGKPETTKPKEAVDHPKQYNSHPSGVECIDIIEHMHFNVGSAIKYLWRAEFKGEHLQDMKKAAWYCQREYERLSKLPREGEVLYKVKLDLRGPHDWKVWKE